jgi:putative pyoverdin transport system ATP-binding/permease protein
LALVSALLEDRPIYVFEEWAAQLDGHARDAFYRELLPELRARGKLVIVITHDDGYDHVADRILRFRDGKLAHERRTNVALRGETV